MQKNALSLILIVIAVGVIVPFLLSSTKKAVVLPTVPNPTDMSYIVPTPTPSPLATTIPGNSVNTFVDSESSIHISYPKHFRVDKSGVHGPADSAARRLISIDALDPAFEYGSDAPFDGMSIYLVHWQGTINEFMEKEKSALQTMARRYTTSSNEFPGTQHSTTYAGIKSVLLKGYSWDGHTRAYIPIPNTDIIIIAGIVEEKPGSFMPAAEKILNSLTY